MENTLTMDATRPLHNYVVQRVTFKVLRESHERAPRKRLSQPEEVFRFCNDERIIPDDAREHFVALMLDSQNGLVAVHQVSTGTLSASLVHPREVFGPAMRLMGVASIILVHNHPSGDPLPSREDLQLTRQLSEAARLLDLKIHDHVIIGNGTGQWVSLAQRGAL